MLTKHANTCHMHVLQVSYDQLCSKLLRDTWFEVFESKIPFFKCSGLSLLAMASYYSPRRVRRSNGGYHSPPTRICEQLLATASKLTREASEQGTVLCLFVSRDVGMSRLKFSSSSLL
jgi:hypothetical protein